MRKQLDQLLSEYNLAKRQVEEETRTLTECQTRVKDLAEAQQILQQIAELVQQQAHKQIAEIVTRCLQAVFGEDSYEFRIKFERKRGRTEARLYLMDSRNNEVDPISSCGGGVVDVCSFALRLAALILTRPARRRLLVLDECFKHLSADYQPRIRDLILTLAKELNVQIITVTHSPMLQIGKVIDLEG